MNIHELLVRCLDCGISLSARDNELRVHYEREAPDGELLALLRQHKHELMRYLLQPTGARISPRSDAQQSGFPASLAQRRMWFVDRFEGAGSAYNMVGLYRVQGRFEINALQEAMNVILAKHEALRTTLHEVDGEIRQLVHEPSIVPLAVVDLSAFPTDLQDVQLRAVIREENARRVDLSTGPLLHVTGVRLDDDTWILILNVHHIACDGWSVQLLEREIGTVYREIAAGGSPMPHAHGPQYGDYVVWSSERDSEAPWRNQLPYWQGVLDGMPSLHNVPLDRARPPVQTFEGGTIRHDLPASWLGDALTLCREHGSTLFMFLHAALSAVIGVYSSESDIIIGFPVAGRRHPQVASTVGLFVNTLVLRTPFDGNASLLDALKRSRQAVIDALDHQDVPYDALIEALRPQRSHAYSPLVQIVLALQNADGAGLNLGGSQVVSMENDDAPVKFDIQIEATQSADGLALAWRFNSAIFDDISAQRMLACLVGLLEQAVQNPLERLFMLLREESTPATEIYCGGYFPRLEDRIGEFVRAFPDRLAVVAEDTSLTYGELDCRAKAVALLLRARGVRAGATVALCTPRSVETIVGMLGILKAGGAYVPLDPAYPSARLALILEDCGAEIMLTKQILAEQLAPLGCSLVLLDGMPAESPHGRFDADDLTVGDATDPAYIIYTSGTTGKPKGVVVAHASVVNLVEHFDEVAPHDESWSGSLWSSISFDVAVYEIFTVLCRGGTLHIVPENLRLAPERLFRWTDDHAITSAFMHAGYLEPYIEYLRQPGSGGSLRRMLVGVEPIASDHLLAVANSLPQLRIVNAYGPTEITVCCTTFLFEPSTHTSGGRVPIGHEVRGTTLFVMNGGGEPAPRGAIGELYVGGIGVALGYLNNSALTDARFVTVVLSSGTIRMYRTGDLVRYRRDGALEFIGRADDQIKIRGFRIEPGEIEVRLCGLNTISDAAVIAVGDGAAKQLVAYVVPRPEYVVQARSGDAFVTLVKRELRKDLPGYMIPDEVIVIDEIPLTTNGKLARASLPPVTSAQIPGERVAPRNDIERRVALIWNAVLHVEDIGVYDDFFALGGQSLLATRLIARVHREFELEGLGLPFGTLFENPTIACFSEVLGRAIQEQDLRRKAARLASLQEYVDEGTF
ncbi:non-ribosomal peptide synthetase [Rhodanobacter sp. MP1X3]|uniref:non-ribosomal peptide synthetase n=1 Tax=Rhodanobacter sp. MP1X3 TaxID=2723086 RepID=UPI001612147A|nr:non-ribosomal peptide synthetase [Rhodanobacter sp. MP1X3]MBB6243702.1 amino acid adenylation domain-containing protein [Rhodanobacter sp. MP1X3]